MPIYMYECICSSINTHTHTHTESLKNAHSKNNKQSNEQVKNMANTHTYIHTAGTVHKHIHIHIISATHEALRMSANRLFSVRIIFSCCMFVCICRIRKRFSCVAIRNLMGQAKGRHTHTQTKVQIYSIFKGLHEVVL